MIVTLTGENSFLLKADLKRRIAEFVAQHGDMSLERLDGEDTTYDRIREALESMPFLSPKKLVVLDRPSANKEFVEKAIELLAEVPETTDVVIVESKPDKRTTYYKFLKKNTELQEFAELDEAGLSRWLVERAKERGASLVTTDARYLVERVGGSQQLLSNELEKILSYSPQISRQTIELLTDETPQSTVFELLDSALAGNTKRALELYAEQRELRVEPIQIVAMLSWQLHVLALVKAAGNRDANEIARESKINPYSVRKTQNLARRLTLAKIKELIKNTLELDVRLKSEPIDADDALQYLLISI